MSKNKQSRGKSWADGLIKKEIERPPYPQGTPRYHMVVSNFAGYLNKADTILFLETLKLQIEKHLRDLGVPKQLKLEECQINADKDCPNCGTPMFVDITTLNSGSYNCPNKECRFTQKI